MSKNVQQLSLALTKDNEKLSLKILDGVAASLIKYDNGHTYTSKQEALVDVATLAVTAKLFEQMSLELSDRTGISPDDQELQEYEYNMFDVKVTTKVKQKTKVKNVSSYTNKELESILPGLTKKAEVVFLDTDKLLNDPELRALAESKGYIKVETKKEFETIIGEEE
jgi:hypothetical protein